MAHTVIPPPRGMTATLELLDVKLLSADVRFQVQNRVSTRQKIMYHPPSNSTKTKPMQVTWYNLTLDLRLERSREQNRTSSTTGLRWRKERGDVVSRGLSEKY